ncbi:MAG: helix-hairpin-helix domain-containing protein [Limnochordaceae bacterium]|nr:helix-hairpin-helix domain-containing protein [Limnochordaceae bacterium]
MTLRSWRPDGLFGCKERLVWSLALLVVIGSFGWDWWQAKRLAPPSPPSGVTPGVFREETAAASSAAAESSDNSTLVAAAQADFPSHSSALPAGASGSVVTTSAAGEQQSCAPAARQASKQAETQPFAALPPAAQDPAASAGLPAPAGGPERIDLNRASLADLDALPGIGPALAERIISYRNEKGPFISVDQLVEVPGIGPSKLAQLRDRLTVSAPGGSATR